MPDLVDVLRAIHYERDKELQVRRLEAVLVYFGIEEEDIPKVIAMCEGIAREGDYVRAKIQALVSGGT